MDCLAEARITRLVRTVKPSMPSIKQVIGTPQGHGSDGKPAQTQQEHKKATDRANAGGVLEGGGEKMDV
jgi:hypothetical protein